MDLELVHRAFSRGADGVFIGGCWPGDCHYVTQGNYDALGNVYLYRKLLRRIGVSPERLRLEWIAASEGTRYAEVMNDFVGQLRELGPLDREGGGGMEAGALARKLRAVAKLIPFLKLVERERLRPPARTEDAYHKFYTSEETDRLFDELIADRLTAIQIVAALQERPLSTGEICALLSLSPSEVSRHMNSSSRQGLVRYDAASRRYALA